jgi:hypothetical protein
MRPNNEATIHHAGSSDEDIRLQLDANATAHLISVLTDIASDPIAYVIREYSTNARDSHIESGNLGPIKVTLPTPGRLIFSVQDFGLGLSVDELRDVYSLYGRSTKRDSDAVNGVLGLGCKSGLTYNDSFNITAVKNGVKVLATVAKDHDGVGTIRVLDTVTTDERNGVRIDIPVKSSFDAERFQSKAEHFYSFWPKGSVLVDGEAPASIRDDSSLIWLDPDVAVGQGISSYVVQHDVAYPIDRYKWAAKFGVIAFVPSGTVNFTPSREALHYTARTEETLAILAEYAEERLVETITARIESEPTPFARLKLIAQWRQTLPSLSQNFFKEFGGAHVKLARNVWRYDRNAYGHAAKQISSLSWYDLLGEQVLVTGYPHKGLSQLNRARLDDFFGECPGVSYRDNLYLIPEGTNLAAIVGRGKLFDWATIEAATEHVRVQRRARGEGAKSQTEYAVHSAGLGRTFSLTAAELADKAADYGYGIAWETDSNYYGGKCADTFVAVIKSRQVAKFQRLFPQAEGAYVVWQRQLKAAEAALTDDDRLKASLSSLGVLTPLRQVIEQIVDPALARVLTLADADESVTLKAYRLRGGQIEQDRDTVQALLDSYPLLKCLSSYEVQNTLEDTVLYINSKYNHTNPAKEQS